MPSTGSSSPPPRIMMIDDEESNLQVVKIVLTREDFPCELLLYTDGRKALEALQHQAVDLILLDLAMPTIDGFEVMGKLHENPATAEIPVIFLSAYQETDYILKAFAMGASDFLGKPIISPVLTARIRQVIHTRGLQKQLQFTNRELVNINRLKDELLSICSHDLRAPLSAIDLLCQFLDDAVAERSTQDPSELLGRIRGQSRLARRLVDNLLDLNRIEEGQLVAAPSFFSAAELMQSIAAEEAPALEARGLSFECAVPPPHLLAFGDREMLSQVLHNLLNNAFKHARTKVRMGATSEGLDSEFGGWLSVSVSDDGRGIPPAEHRRIFEKYAKLDQHSGGSGLGLYISRQMAGLHQGSLGVESTVGRGATFTLKLPNLVEPEMLPDLGPHHRKPIWIVSSSRALGQMLEGLLTEGGMLEVHTLSPTKDLVAAAEAQMPTLAIVDADSEQTVQQVTAALGTNQNHIRYVVLLRDGALHDASAAGALSQGPALPLPVNPVRLLRHVAEQLQAVAQAGLSISVSVGHD